MDHRIPLAVITACTGLQNHRITEIVTILHQLFIRICLSKIRNRCKNVAEAATLINFLLNEEKGASIMGSECGIPASKAGLKFAQDAGAVKSLVAEANAKVMAFTTNKLDPLFENNDLKASGTGIYQEVFDNIDYGDETPEEAVNGLLDGMESVGYTIA